MVKSSDEIWASTETYWTNLKSVFGYVNEKLQNSIKAILYWKMCVIAYYFGLGQLYVSLSKE